MLCRACTPHVPVTRALAVPTLRLVHTAALRHALSLAHSPQSQSQRPSLTREALRTRSFASSPHRRAEEDPNLQRVFDNQQKVLQFLQDKPEVLEYMKEFVTLLKDNGALNVYMGIADVRLTNGLLPRDRTPLVRTLFRFVPVLYATHCRHRRAVGTDAE